MDGGPFAEEGSRIALEKLQRDNHRAKTPIIASDCLAFAIKDTERIGRGIAKKCPYYIEIIVNDGVFNSDGEAIRCPRILIDGMNELSFIHQYESTESAIKKAATKALSEQVGFRAVAINVRRVSGDGVPDPCGDLMQFHVNLLRA